MEESTNIVENNDAMFLRHAVRDYIKNNKIIKPDTWYNMSFDFNVDEKNIVTVNDIKTNEIINEKLNEKFQTEKENLFDETGRLKMSLEYDRVMEENDTLKTTDKIIKTKDNVLRDLNKHYNKWIST